MKTRERERERERKLGLNLSCLKDGLCCACLQKKERREREEREGRSTSFWIGRVMDLMSFMFLMYGGPGVCGRGPGVCGPGVS